MAIQQVKMYEAVCDVCGDKYEDNSGYYAYYSISKILEHLDCVGWKLVGHKVYCFSCNTDKNETNK